MWALAGSVRRQQQRIATMIGISTLVEMLMTSERLQYIAGMAMISLVTENIENQNKIVRGDGIRPLVRLLRSRKTSQKVTQLDELYRRKRLKVAFHLSGLAGPICQFLNGTHDFSELARMSLLMDHRRSVLPLRSSAGIWRFVARK